MKDWIKKIIKEKRSQIQTLEKAQIESNKS